MHHALRCAYADEGFAAGPLGAVWERVVVPSIDLLVDGRLVRLAPSQGEYFILAAQFVLLARCYRAYGRFVGLTADDIGAPFERLPSSVLAPERRRRTYLNAVLARAEASSSYAPARRLWIRERRGRYVPNPALSVRVLDERGEEAWRPMAAHLGLDLLERHVAEIPSFGEARAG